MPLHIHQSNKKSITFLPIPKKYNVSFHTNKQLCLQKTCQNVLYNTRLVMNKNKHILKSYYKHLTSLLTCFSCMKKTVFKLYLLEV